MELRSITLTKTAVIEAVQCWFQHCVFKDDSVPQVLDVCLDIDNGTGLYTVTLSRKETPIEQAR